MIYKSDHIAAFVSTHTVFVVSFMHLAPGLFCGEVMEFPFFGGFSDIFFLQTASSTLFLMQYLISPTFLGITFKMCP